MKPDYRHCPPLNKLNELAGGITALVIRKRPERG